MNNRLPKTLHSSSTPLRKDKPEIVNLPKGDLDKHLEKCLLWEAEQPEKIKAIVDEWRKRQLAEITDEQLIEAIGRITFKDYPKQKIIIKA